MQVDKITFNDISIFHHEEEFSIFHKLNFTKTVGGKEWLRRFFSEPHQDLKHILGTQNIIKALLDHIDDWPPEITNGTIIMMDKFLDYNLDPVPKNITDFPPLPINCCIPMIIPWSNIASGTSQIFFQALKKSWIFLRIPISLATCTITLKDCP